MGISRSQTVYAPTSINTGTEDFRERVRAAAQSKSTQFGFGFDASNSVELEVDGSDGIVYVENQKEQNYGAGDCETLLEGRKPQIIGLRVRPMADIFQGTALEAKYSAQSALLRAVADEVVRSAVQCAASSCSSSSGVCAPIAQAWERESDPPTNYLKLYENYNCICKNTEEFNGYPHYFASETTGTSTCLAQTACSAGSKRNFQTGICEKCDPMTNSKDLVSCSACLGGSVLIDGECKCESTECHTLDLASKTCTNNCFDLKIGEHIAGPYKGEGIFLKADKYYKWATEAAPDTKIGLEDGLYWYVRANNVDSSWRFVYHADSSVEIHNKIEKWAYLDWGHDVVASTGRHPRDGKWFLYDTRRTIIRGSQELKLFKIKSNRNDKHLYVKATNYMGTDLADLGSTMRFFIEDASL